MDVKQVYALMNLAKSQITGAEKIDVIDASSFVSFGDAVLGNSANRDNFLGIIAPEIAKTVVRTLDTFDIAYRNIMVDGFTFGTFLRKLTVRLLPAHETESWNVGSQDFVPTNFKIDKPDVTQKLFTGIKTFEFDLTIPDNLFRGSFRSAEDMGALITAMTDALITSVKLYVNYANRLAVNTAIARVIDDGKRVVHVLTEYGQAGLTPEQALRDSGLLAFTGTKIDEHIAYMREPSVLYNEEKELRATSRDNMHVFLNRAFTSATKRYLQANTYWKDLVELPLFEEVVAWQGLVTEAEGELQTLPTFKNTSTIDMTIKKGDTTTTVNQSYIIGALFDRQHVFTTLYDNRMHTDRNNRNEYTNYTNIVDIGHGVDPSENALVFVLD